MYFAIYDLYEKIVKYDEVFIYGMGMYAETIIPKLFEMGLDEKVAGIVVSDKTTKNKYKNGKPIYSIDDLQVGAHKYIFLIAVSCKYEKEIENELMMRGYASYILLSYYMRDNVNAYFRFKSVDLEQYCKIIADWYEFEHSDELQDDICKAHNRIYKMVYGRFSQKSTSVKNMNQIVFVIGYLHPRILKIMDALAKQKFEIIIIDMELKKFYPYSNYNKDEESQVIYCRSIEEVCFEAVKFNPLLFYVRPVEVDCSLAKILLNQKVCYGTIVVDIHDIMCGSYNLPIEKRWIYELERETLESADGIVWRYDAESFLREKYGFCYQGKSVQFWDYCYDDFAIHVSNQGDVLKLCCIDSGAECLMPPDDERLCKAGIKRYANIRDILARLGNREDCTFSLFVSRVSNETEEILKQIRKQYKNFEYYIGYSPKKLIQCVAEQDYGCEFFMSGRIPSDEECINKGYLRMPGTYEVSATNRYFDYINAGIPIVSDGGKRQCDYLKEFGVLVNMTLDSIDIQYLKDNKKMMRENVKRAQKDLSVSAHVGKLIDFFYEL